MIPRRGAGSMAFAVSVAALAASPRASAEPADRARVSDGDSVVSTPESPEIVHGGRRSERLSPLHGLVLRGGGGIGFFRSTLRFAGWDPVKESVSPSTEELIGVGGLYDGFVGLRATSYLQLGVEGAWHSIGDASVARTSGPVGAGGISRLDVYRGGIGLDVFPLGDRVLRVALSGGVTHVRLTGTPEPPPPEGEEATPTLRAPRDVSLLGPYAAAAVAVRVVGNAELGLEPIVRLEAAWYRGTEQSLAFGRPTMTAVTPFVGVVATYTP
jgi:hypothetical protein